MEMGVVKPKEKASEVFETHGKRERATVVVERVKHVVAKGRVLPKGKVRVRIKDPRIRNFAAERQLVDGVLPDTEKKEWHKIEYKGVTGKLAITKDRYLEPEKFYCVIINGTTASVKLPKSPSTSMAQDATSKTASATRPGSVEAAASKSDSFSRRAFSLKNKIEKVENKIEKPDLADTVEVRGKYLEVVQAHRSHLSRMKSVKAAAGKTVKMGKSVVSGANSVIKGIQTGMYAPGEGDDELDLDPSPVGKGKETKTATKTFVFDEDSSLGIMWKVVPPSMEKVVMNVSGQAKEKGVEAEDVLLAIMTGPDKDRWDWSTLEESGEEWCTEDFENAIGQLPVPITVKVARQVEHKEVKPQKESKRSEEVRKATNLHQFVSWSASWAIWEDLHTQQCWKHLAHHLFPGMCTNPRFDRLHELIRVDPKKLVHPKFGEVPSTIDIFARAQLLSEDELQRLVLTTLLVMDEQLNEVAIDKQLAVWEQRVNTKGKGFMDEIKKMLIKAKMERIKMLAHRKTDRRARIKAIENAEKNKRKDTERIMKDLNSTLAGRLEVWLNYKKMANGMNSAPRWETIEPKKVPPSAMSAKRLRDELLHLSEKRHLISRIQEKLDQKSQKDYYLGVLLAEFLLSIVYRKGMSWSDRLFGVVAYAFFACIPFPFVFYVSSCLADDVGVMSEYCNEHGIEMYEALLPMVLAGLLFTSNFTWYIREKYAAAARSYLKVYRAESRTQRELVTVDTEIPGETEDLAIPDIIAQEMRKKKNMRTPGQVQLLKFVMVLAMCVHFAGFGLLRRYIENETLWGGLLKPAPGRDFDDLKEDRDLTKYPHSNDAVDGTKPAIIAAGTLSALASCALLSGIIQMYRDVDDLDKRTKILISVSRVKAQGSGEQEPTLKCCSFLDTLGGMVSTLLLGGFAVGGDGEEDDDNDDDDSDEDEEQEEEEEGEEGDEEEGDDGNGPAKTGTRHINLALASSQDKVPNVQVWGYYKNVIALQLGNDVKKCECFLTPLCISALFLAFVLVLICSFIPNPSDYLELILLGMFDIIITLVYVKVYASRMIKVMERLEDMVKPLKEAKVRLVANSQYYSKDEAAEAKKTGLILSSLIEEFSNSQMKLQVLGIKVTAVKLNSFLATVLIGLGYLIQAVLQISPFKSSFAPTQSPTQSPTSLNLAL
jgi:hypothetical protein